MKNLLQQKLRPNLTALFQQKLRSNLTGVSNTRVLPVGSGWKAKAIGTAAGRKHLILCKDIRHTGKTVTIVDPCSHRAAIDLKKADSYM